MPRAKIVYVAPFEHDYGTEFHIVRDAAAIGCEVFSMREDVAKPYPEVFAHVMREAPDVVLYTKGRGVGRDADWQLAWRALERDGIKTASFSLDLYRGLARESEVGNNAFWTTGTVFTADGGSQDWFAHRGVNHHWLPPACVSDECIEVEDWTDGPEIVFVGSSMTYHHEHHWRMEMLTALTNHYPSFGVYGPHSGKTIRGLALNALYQTPRRIVIGDSLALPGHTRYTSDRLFETLGRGGFLIWPRMDWLGDEFGLIEGEHFICYEPGNVGDLFDRIDFWRDHPDQAREVAQAGQTHVREHHTYRNRVDTMLTVLGL